MGLGPAAAGCVLEGGDGLRRLRRCPTAAISMSPASAVNPSISATSIALSSKALQASYLGMFNHAATSSCRLRDRIRRPLHGLFGCRKVYHQEDHGPNLLDAMRPGLQLPF